MNVKQLKDIIIIPSAMSLDTTGAILETAARAAQLGAAKLATLAENEKFKKMGKVKIEALHIKSQLDLDVSKVLREILKGNTNEDLDAILNEAE